LDWDTWADDPARAIGHLVPDAVAAVATAGTGALDQLERPSYSASNRDIVDGDYDVLGGRDTSQEFLDEFYKPTGNPDYPMDWSGRTPRPTRVGCRARSGSSIRVTCRRSTALEARAASTSAATATR
jgi:hypothetical protein